MDDELISLREFSDKDLSLFQKWLYTPHVADWYTNPSDWIDEVEKRNSDYKWLHHYIAEKEGKPIGFCQYYEYRNSGEAWHGSMEISGTYSIDYLIGDTSYLNKGFGKLMVRQLIDKIRTHENVKRIIVQPEPENKPSCKTLLSCGFNFDETNGIYVLDITHIASKEEGR